jgi:hypothetical protein
MGEFKGKCGRSKVSRGHGGKNSKTTKKAKIGKKTRASFKKTGTQLNPDAAGLVKNERKVNAAKKDKFPPEVKERLKEEAIKLIKESCTKEHKMKPWVPDNWASKFKPALGPYMKFVKGLTDIFSLENVSADGGNFDIKLNVGLGKSANAASEGSQKVAPKASPKAAPKASPKITPKDSPKAAPKASPKTTPKASPKASPKDAPKLSPKLSPKSAPAKKKAIVKKKAMKKQQPK